MTNEPSIRQKYEDLKNRVDRVLSEIEQIQDGSASTFLVVYRIRDILQDAPLTDDSFGDSIHELLTKEGSS